MLEPASVRQDVNSHPPALDLRARLDVIWRRRWVVVAVTLASIAVGVFVTLRSPAVYEATTTMLIDPNAPEVLSGVRDVYDLGTGKYWATQEYYETQYNLLRSRPVAQRALSILGVSPDSARAELEGAIQASGGRSTTASLLAAMSENTRGSVQHTIDFLGLGQVQDAGKLVKTLEQIDAAQFVQGVLKVKPVKDSHLVRLSVEQRQPAMAADIANAVAIAYIDVNLDQKVELTKSAVDWLRNQVGALKVKLESSEIELYNFKRDNGIVSASFEDRQTMVAQTLEQLNAQLSDAVSKRIALESKRNQLAAVRNNKQPLDAVEDVLHSTIVQELKVTLSKLREEQAESLVRYTSEHPRSIALEERARNVQIALDAEIAKIFTAGQNEYETAQSTERGLRDAIERVKTDALELNKKEIEYSRLSRERDNNKELYSLVVTRQKEADLTQMLRVNNVRQLEAALPPQRPIKPRPLMNFAVSVAFGLFLALVLANVVDMLDNTIKTQDQVEKLLNLPLLGVVPTIKEKDVGFADSSRDFYVLNHPRSVIAECCRSIRTNIMFMSPGNPVRTMLVTSGAAREGKSTTALTLAITIAQSGARTLIVDTDLRRPRLHKSFGISDAVGVSSLIVGEGNLDEALHQTHVPNLDVLLCGPIPPNPSELLHTEAFARLVDQLRGRYQRIIFDSPPVGAVTDAQVLAAMADGVVYVVQAGKTPWQPAKRSLRSLADVGGKLFGIVLNNVDFDGSHSRSGYGYTYYAYGAEDNKAPATS